MLEFIWTWILSHMPQMTEGATLVKTIADTAASIKKLAPEKLEAKEAAVNQLNQTASIVEDKGRSFEEKQWEADTRIGLAEEMVKLTAIEASYNIARYSIFVAFTAYMFHLFTRFVTRPKKQSEATK